MNDGSEKINWVLEMKSYAIPLCFIIWTPEYNLNHIFKETNFL